MSSTVRLPHASRRACSPSLSRSTFDNDTVGATVTAISTRFNCSTSVSIRDASNTSVRNSTRPPIPADSPASVKRSPRKKARSMAAVWVSIRIDVTSRSTTVSLSGPVFCHASMTWIKG